MAIGPKSRPDRLSVVGVLVPPAEREAPDTRREVSTPRG